MPPDDNAPVPLPASRRRRASNKPDAGSDTSLLRAVRSDVAITLAVR